MFAQGMIKNICRHSKKLTSRIDKLVDINIFKLCADTSNSFLNSLQGNAPVKT